MVEQITSMIVEGRFSSNGSRHERRLVRKVGIEVTSFVRRSNMMIKLDCLKLHQFMSAVFTRGLTECMSLDIVKSDRNDVETELIQPSRSSDLLGLEMTSSIVPHEAV